MVIGSIDFSPTFIGIKLIASKSGICFIFRYCPMCFTCFYISYNTYNSASIKELLLRRRVKIHLKNSEHTFSSSNFFPLV